MTTLDRIGEQLRAIRASIRELEDTNFRMMAENGNIRQRALVVNEINTLRTTERQLTESALSLTSEYTPDPRETIDIITRRIFDLREQLGNALQGEVVFGRDPRVLVPTLENSIERLVRSRDTLLRETVALEQLQPQPQPQPQQEEDEELEEVRQASIMTAEEDARLREEIGRRREAEDARIAELRALPSYQDVVGVDRDMPVDDDTDEELEQIAERMVGRDLLEGDDDPMLEA
jgi:hypothetical protein